MGEVYNDGYRVVGRSAEKHPTMGGAHAFYVVAPNEPGGEVHDLDFQHDTIPEVGVVAWTNETVIAVVIDRLQGFQSGGFSCRENAIAITKLQEALHWLEHRTAERRKRGVEGKHEA